MLLEGADEPAGDGEQVARLHRLVLDFEQVALGQQLDNGGGDEVQEILLGRPHAFLHAGGFAGPLPFTFSYEPATHSMVRIHGVRSGSVRAEKAVIGHLSYGFVFSEQFRLEAFYDHGLLTDREAGYHHELFQGLGIAGQTVGPWGTLLRLDIGKTVGRNAQNGFVANVVFLKLF